MRKLSLSSANEPHVDHQRPRDRAAQAIERWIVALAECTAPGGYAKAVTGIAQDRDAIHRALAAQLDAKGGHGSIDAVGVRLGRKGPIPNQFAPHRCRSC